MTEQGPHTWLLVATGFIDLISGTCLGIPHMGVQDQLSCESTNVAVIL